jgi:hypothetical protein
MPPADAGQDSALGLAQITNQDLKPLTEGPLHEAFLSPRKDRNPVHVPKAPGPAISERPAVDPPNANAQ